ncbi:hypothetical protein PHLGIDRAFT_125272 [Phlebiopsis gigantea 11061_1 CR5-6]|uniref:Enoyl reductase (ER) domain-containing protein n=1 Tax=Phlebiopsis gigantea (strain 11061_1 CR5-6) TaxID=745531 RepID=A0A0C3SEQ6_PHLG1|nr:hypothetical protein PHLGIDRAFT_125272 [Phlebiopsis gigantea 11061_1 CR5-6]
MRAARFYGAGDIRVEEVPEPVIKPGQVKLKLAWCGICGTDLHYFQGFTTGAPSKTKAHYITKEKLPVVMGHEFSGTIVEIGPEVDSNKFAVGQNVAVEPLISCMESGCVPCSENTRNCCAHANFLGIAGWGGGLSEYITVNQAAVYPLPAGIPLEIGALVEPLAIAWHAVKRSAFRPGDKCLIMGSGPIGLMMSKVLQAKGAGWIGVSEPSEGRRQMALEQGASQVFDPRKDDVVAAVRALTANQGADVAFECAGIQATLDTAIKSLRSRGSFVNVAVWETPAQINLTYVLLKELVITGTIGYDRDHGEVMQALAEGKFQGLEKLVTKKIDLKDLVEGGIKCLISEKDTQIKILVAPHL